MASWSFEPGHTEAEFRARHMMVTWVRGLFKDIHGRLEFDANEPVGSTFEGRIDATRLWTGEPDRDEHLRSADFFDVDNHPAIEFRGRISDREGPNQFKALADLTIRGVTREVPMVVRYEGVWETPYWVGDENRGTMRRIGFAAVTVVNRHDFGVSWQDELPGGGIVVSNEVRLALDVEAIADEDLARVGEGAAVYRPEDLPQTARAGTPDAPGD